MAEKRQEEDALNLRGKTLREVQRRLGFSSPSLALLHLEKLLNWGLVEKDNFGRYRAVKKVDVAILQPFTKIGRFMLPRFTFYATFFTTLTIIAYIIQT